MSDSHHWNFGSSGSAPHDDDDKQDFSSQSLYYTTGTGAAHHEPPSPPASRIPGTNIYTTNPPHRYPSSIANSELDRRTQYSNDYEHHHYQVVPRPERGDRNPKLHEIKDDRNVQDAITYINANLHYGSSVNQPSAHRRSYGNSFYQHYDDSRKLGMSNLSHLNSTRSPMNSMQRRTDVDQRDESYDAAGEVGRHSDYDGPEMREYIGDEDEDEDEGDDVEDEDDASEEYEETLYDIHSVRSTGTFQ